MAVFQVVRERDILEGKLSCAICGSEFPVSNGTADFGGNAAGAGDGELSTLAPEGEPPLDDMQIAALLDLTAPGGTILLESTTPEYAARIAETFSVRVLALNPCAGETNRTPRSSPDSVVGSIVSHGRLPLADDALRGSVVSSPAPERVSEAARVTRPGGRIVAPAGADFPPTLTELARNEKIIVAEKARVLSLTRRSRKPGL